MKIKQVCEKTGLTDRAIRYYIEEGLVCPAYTENYMGRRAYDFTDADVTALNHVATLRKFGFTVEEIRRILTDPQESVAVVAEVRARKEETVRQEGENLDALARLEAEKAYTVAELAEKLVEPVRKVVVPMEDGRWSWRALAGGIVWYAALLVTGALPVWWLVEGTVSGMKRCYYPNITPGGFVCDALIILLPTIVLGLMWLLKRHRPGRRSWRAYAALGLCVLYLPVSFAGAVFLICESETASLSAYRRFDTECKLNNDPFFQVLFPVVGGWSGDIDRYYYRYDPVIFPNYDVYAEWTLSPEELRAEVERVTQLFAALQEDDPLFMPQEDYSRFEQGGFVCLTYSSRGMVETMLEPSEYEVLAFAYNEQTGQVRYIAYYGGQKPYYTTLDW